MHVEYIGIKGWVIYSVEVDDLVVLPVDGDIIWDMVDDLHKHCIVFPGIKCGSWKLPIHGDNGLGWTESGFISQHHLYTLPRDQNQHVRL